MGSFFRFYYRFWCVCQVHLGYWIWSFPSRCVQFLHLLLEVIQIYFIWVSLLIWFIVFSLNLLFGYWTLHLFFVCSLMVFEFFRLAIFGIYNLLRFSSHLGIISLLPSWNACEFSLSGVSGILLRSHFLFFFSHLLFIFSVKSADFSLSIVVEIWILFGHLLWSWISWCIVFLFSLFEDNLSGRQWRLIERLWSSWFFFSSTFASADSTSFNRHVSGSLCEEISAWGWISQRTQTSVVVWRSLQFWRCILNRILRLDPSEWSHILHWGVRPFIIELPLASRHLIWYCRSLIDFWTLLFELLKSYVFNVLIVFWSSISINRILSILIVILKIRRIIFKSKLLMGKYVFWHILGSIGRINVVKPSDLCWIWTL